jgi:hypothetical protein
MKTNLLIIAALTLLSFSSAEAQLYSANSTANTVTDFNILTGTQTVVVKSNEGLNVPTGLAVIGNDLFVANSGTGTISEFNAVTGTLINAEVASGFSSIAEMAVTGNTLLVVNAAGFDVSKLTVSGTSVTLNSSDFISTPRYSYPNGIAISGNTVYVDGAASNSVSTYNLTTGAVITNNLISSNLNNPIALLVDGSDLFVANDGNNEISEYTLSGALVKLNFISTSAPFGLTASSDGNDLFVGNNNTGVVSEYSASTGALITSDLMTVSRPTQLLYVPSSTPEPKSWALALLVLAAIAGLHIQRSSAPGATC